jgi:hypothetical protein
VIPAFFDAVTTRSEGSDPSLTTANDLTADVPGASASMASGAVVGTVEMATDPARITLSATCT